MQQEDACQALTVLTYLPKHKYDSHGGPKLRDIATTLANWGGSLTDLLGKNISFLHNGDGTISLAPMYDVMCTTHYDGRDGSRPIDTELGLFIGAKTDILQVEAQDLITESARWGLRTGTAARTIAELADAVLSTIGTARAALDLDGHIDDRSAEPVRALLASTSPHLTSPHLTPRHLAVPNVTRFCRRRRGWSCSSA